MNLFKSIIVLFALFLLSTTCSLAQRYTTDTIHSSYIKSLSTDPGQRVTLMDQGLQMPIGSGTIPEGWQLTQDIATNPNTGMYDRYRQEIRGTQGELIASFAPSVYSSTLGQDLEKLQQTMVQTWFFQKSLRQTMVQALQGEITNLRLGTIQRSETLENNQQFQEIAQTMQVEGLEASMSGTRNGETISGMAHVVLMKSPHDPNVGVYTLSVVLSPAHLLPQTLHTAEQIQNSFQPNPQWQERVKQIMQPYVPTPDKYWRKDTTDYYRWDAYDSLYDTQDDYWGENEPSYNPDSLPGDWQEITPQNPGY